jgi:hypothetical protein
MTGLVKIVTPGDGCAIGTKVYDAESGQELKGIESIEMGRIDSQSVIIRADIGFMLVDFEGFAEPRFRVIDPRSGEFRAFKRIVFEDDDIFEA